MKNSEFIAVIVIVLVAVSAIGGMFYYFRTRTGTVYSPTSVSTNQPSSSGLPIWHTFDNVFNSNCNPDNCLSAYYTVSSGCDLGTTVLTCSYAGTSYYGYIELGASVQYCNLQPNGAIPEVNGTLVPYLGCVLSRAPLNFLFSNLLTLSGSGNSIQMWAGSFGPQVTVYPTENYQRYSCSYQGSGAMNCDYQGSVYSGTSFDYCNIGTAIQVNGEPVPLGDCLLPRN
jgi:hypothetical protein